MDPKTAQILLGAAGSGGVAGPLYVDDVFSTFLFDGNGSSQQIQNGIDLSGEGGLVWIKRRNNTDDHRLFDTERASFNKYLTSSGTAAETFIGNFGSTNSDGFTMSASATGWNETNGEYCSWTFRKAPGFFDIVTYTGNGSSSRTISHNLGSEPGLLIVKNTSSSDSWYVKVDSSNSFSYNKYLKLDTTDAFTTSDNTIWAGADATSTVFSVGGTKTNNNNDNYVAYLFANGDQSFGADEDEAIIKCGIYSGNGTSGRLIDLGFEPQWLLHRRANSSNDWKMFDVMRGMDHADDQQLKANENEAELAISDTLFTPAATGFIVESAGSSYNASGGEYIYIAIRRPHKPPEAATDVFAPKVLTTTIHDPWTPGFAPDAYFTTKHTVSNSNGIANRLIGGKNVLITNGTDAELTGTKYFHFDLATGKVKQTFQQSTTDDGLNYVFKRAPGFFDVVAYTGTGSTKTVQHNLTVKPDLILIKRRANAAAWTVYNSVSGATKRLILNDTAGADALSSRFNDTEPTSSVFTVHTHSTVNASGGKYIAYLFSSLDGICKISSYTGTGNNVDVDCGFTAGARFVLVKNLDTTSNNSWYVWDSERGIVSGDDPHIFLNSNAAQDTNDDYIDPLNAGFTITSSAGSDLNASGGTYLFLAIA